MDNSFSYGIIGYNSINIGDEAQVIAAMRFLPRIDEIVQREQIKNFAPQKGKITKLIMNAWWMWKPKNFLPPKTIKPLLVSMFIRSKIRKEILSPKVREFLIKNGPVGCRDMDTKEWLDKENIPAYFSGCLTLTLQKNPELEKKDYILCVETPKNVVEYIKTKTDRPVYSLTKKLSPYFSYQERLKLTKIWLKTIQQAHCVISPNLHTCLPALALETPVLRLVTHAKDTDIRWSGMENFVNSVEKKDLLEGCCDYDFDNPKQNPENYLKMRQELINTCAKFTGYNNNNTLLDNNIDPVVEFLKISEYKYVKNKKILYFATIKDLFITLKNKLFGIDKFSIKNDCSKDVELQKSGFLEKIFSVKNEGKRPRHHKVINVMGIKIKICKK